MGNFERFYKVQLASMSLWSRLGVYRTLPFFFIAGAAIEWFMINVRVGKETFCE